ncbi:hypothetical protein [Xanthomonas axonopodis]
MIKIQNIEKQPLTAEQQSKVVGYFHNKNSDRREIEAILDRQTLEDDTHIVAKLAAKAMRL